MLYGLPGYGATRLMAVGLLAELQPDAPTFDVGSVRPLTCNYCCPRSSLWPRFGEGHSWT